MSGYYRLERHITDEAIEVAIIDILCRVRIEMQQKFSDLAIDAAFPEGARPLWCLSWEYRDDRGES